MKIPVSDLCRQASVGRQVFYDAMAGRFAPRPATLAKLDAALDRLKLAYRGDPGPAACHAAWRAAVVIAAGQLGARPRDVLAADPAAKATGNAAWLAAAQARRLAYWIANGQLGLKISDVARAAGVTKQAVSRAIKELEDDDAARKTLEKVEEVFG